MLSINKYIIGEKDNKFAMLNKMKLTDLFLRRESHKKQQPRQIPTFDQNSFLCRLIHRGLNTQLVRIQTQLKESGNPLDELKCRWFLKNARDYQQVEDLSSSFYQPCLDDVGSIICVQIQPKIQGWEYTGITIMKETQPVQLDPELEEKLQSFLKSDNLRIPAHIESIFSQNPKYEEMELPIEIKVVVSHKSVVFLENQTELNNFQITQDYPQVEFIRKSFNSIIFTFNDRESMKIRFNNNFDRDMFALAVRTSAARAPEQINYQQIEELKENPEQQDNKSSIQVIPCSSSDDFSVDSLVQTIPSNEKQLELEYGSSTSLKIQQERSSDRRDERQQNYLRHSNTLMVLRFDQQSRQIKSLKRRYDELMLNYNIQKQSKMVLEKQMDSIKGDFSKLKIQNDKNAEIGKKINKTMEDNRFYKNQIALLKKELNEAEQREIILQLKIKQQANQHDRELTNRLQRLKQENVNLQKQKQQAYSKREEAEIQTQKMKLKIQQLQNEISMMRKKFQSLMSEKNLIQGPKVESTDGKQAVLLRKKVAQMQMKAKNLQMLLKYRSSQGVNQGGMEGIGMQLVVNKLTQTIAQKEQELQEVRKINKALLEKIKNQ